MRTRTAKGWHFFYRHPGTLVRNTAHIKSADQTIELDVRADGGFVVGPGSVHETGVPYEMLGVWPDTLDDLPVFDPAWLATEDQVRTTTNLPDRPPMRHVRRWRERADQKELLSRARAYLRATPLAIQGEGGDTHTYQAVCRIVRGFDLDESDARELLLEWNPTCVPPWSERELDEKIAGALKYGTEPIGARAEARDQVRTTTNLTERVTGQVEEDKADQPVSSALPDFLAQTSTLPARDELLPGLIARGETTGLYGAPRTLKTWAVLEIAVALTTGTPAFGMQMPRTRARVLYLTNEDSAASVAARLRGLLAGRELETAPEEFRLMVHGGVALDDPEWQAWLINEVRQFEIDLVDLDPLRSVTLGVDQGPREFQPFGNYLRRLIGETGCGMMFAHHDTKPQTA